MRRFDEHFVAALRATPSGASSPLAAELESGRPPLRRSTFRGLPLFHHESTTAASAFRADDGLPFDPDDAIACLQLERYVDTTTAEEGRLRALYYLVKPLLPRTAQLAAQRQNARRRLRDVRFPRWPADATLDSLLLALLGDYMRQAELEAVPFLGFWPRRARWAWCLTHDVDTGFGQKHVDALARVEEERGLRSSWYFVPERYPVDHVLRRALGDRGHEIGVHGLQHSGKLFASRSEFDSRVGRINAYVQEWQAVGFRSPATYRNPNWLPEIAVDYDSSYMDVATLEPQRGGTCGAFPFMLSERMVELPITLPMDHTLINVLRQDVVAACMAKFAAIHARHGLALALFHPDYNTTLERRAIYGTVLDRLHDTPHGWFALPHEIASWWQRRRQSRVVQQAGSVRIEGPAAVDGVVWWARRDGDRVQIEPGGAES